MLGGGSRAGCSWEEFQKIKVDPYLGRTDHDLDHDVDNDLDNLDPNLPL